MNQRSYHAFSLSELLLALTIVSVIALTAWPLISGARREMERTTCVANLRQLGTALFSYAAEHRGILPPVASRMGGSNVPDYWRRAVLPYVGKEQAGADVWETPFICPPVARHLKKRNIRPNIASYGMNTMLERLPLARLRLPAQTLMATEADLRASIPSEVMNPHQMAYIAPGIHGAGQNLLYADGRVIFFYDVTRLAAPPYLPGGELDVWTP